MKLPLVLLVLAAGLVPAEAHAVVHIGGKSPLKPQHHHHRREEAAAAVQAAEPPPPVTPPAPAGW